MLGEPLSRFGEGVFTTVACEAKHRQHEGLEVRNRHYQEFTRRVNQPAIRHAVRHRVSASAETGNLCDSELVTRIDKAIYGF